MRHFSLISPEISSLSLWKGVMSHRKGKCRWEFSKWTVTNGQKAANQRQARPLLHHSLRKYPGLSPRSSITQRVYVFFMCVYVQIYMCMFVIFRQVKQFEWFSLQESLVRSTASLFIPMPISSISQMTEILEGARAARPNSSVTVSYQGFLSAQQMDDEDQITGQALPSRQI